ncbi:MAG: alpha-amylase [Clostridia bacterium]|nr:alpha-amylase [Clostridia bacterium]
MAKNTELSLRNALIYQVYVRNHTEDGTFNALISDLDRIKKLGTDIVYLMPIHPIGVEGKKGSLGCPYANRDYRAVNPEYGTMDDFIRLADEIHRRGMKLMIDVVYNHTSPDSVLRYEHPEFFYHSADGSFGNRFGDWADVIDFDHTNPALADYLVETLKFWAQYVDGFRCDVASLVPVSLWKRARQECEEIKPGIIWLAETVHTSFNCLARIEGMELIYSDAEGYEAFDIEYDYDIREKLDDYWAGKRPLHEYIDALNHHEAEFPANYIKLRCLENHDQPRIAGRIQDPIALSNWNAFMFFQKGTPMIYAGQEFCDQNQPSLFDIDRVNWTGRDISAEITALAAFKKAHYPENAWFSAETVDEKHTVIARCGNKNTCLLGTFTLRGTAECLYVDIPDGEYENLLSGERAEVKNGKIHTDGKPLVLKIK